MDYLRFILCLSIGLVGLSMVLTKLLDTLFAEWDVVEDVKSAWHRPRRSQAQLELQEEGVDKSILVTRINRSGQGREPAHEPYVPPPFPEEVEASAQAPEPELVAAG